MSSHSMATSLRLYCSQTWQVHWVSPRASRLRCACHACLILSGMTQTGPGRSRNTVICKERRWMDHTNPLPHGRFSLLESDAQNRAAANQLKDLLRTQWL